MLSTATPPPTTGTGKGKFYYRIYCHYELSKRTNERIKESEKRKKKKEKEKTKERLKGKMVARYTDEKDYGSFFPTHVTL